MPDVREAIRALLATDPATAAIVAGRVRPGWMGARDPMPAVLFNVLATDPVRTLTGSSRVATSRVQVDAVATDPATAAALATAIRDRLECYRGTIAGVRLLWVAITDAKDIIEPPESGSDDPAIHRITMDARFKYRF